MLLPLEEGGHSISYHYLSISETISPKTRQKRARGSECVAYFFKKPLWALMTFAH